MTRMASHKNPTPPVFDDYGAPMGRKSKDLSIIDESSADDPPFTLRRIKIDSGGYDRGGAYWGLGQPLYWWDFNGHSGFFRAANRKAAKNLIREIHPLARFFS